MSNIVTKAHRALVEPETVEPFVRTSLLTGRRHICQYRLGPLLGGITGTLFGSNLYLNYLSWTNGKQPVEREIEGSVMFLDPEMRGISQDLLMYGVREELSKELFVEQLHRLMETRAGDITVLEVGANIGYYPLLEALVLGSRANVLAFEPDPRNIRLLRRSIERNEYGDRISAEQTAIGAEDSVELKFNLAEHSNKNHVECLTDDVSWETVKQITVTQQTVSTILERESLPPNAVDVIRMDIEGYEANAFRGMADVLEAGHPMVIFIELHPLRMDDEYFWLLSRLEECGFEIVAGTQMLPSGPEWYEEIVPIDTYDQLREQEHGGHLILRRE